jgi:hypothetical protein
VDDATMHIGQPEIPSSISVSQPFVIQAQRVKDGRVEIVEVDGMADRFATIFIGLAVGQAASHTTAGHPKGKPFGIVPASGAILKLCKSPDFPAPNDQRFVQHPAAQGGVVKSNEWTKGRLKVTDEAVKVAMADGQAVDIDRADIGDLTVEDKQVSGEERTVIQVEHSEGDISVETHLAGEEFHATVLRTMLEDSAEQNRADLDLSSTEKRVIMALHSGVSPFDLPNFVGIDVDKTE